MSTCAIMFDVGHAVELGLGVEDEPVREHGLGERLDVVGHDVVPAARRRRGSSPRG